MNYFKRAVASVTRRPGKSITLLLLLFVLGNIIAGAISIRQAVNNTEANLRAQLPAIATVDRDWSIHDLAWANNEDVPEGFFDPISGEALEALGNLPYVESFDFSLRLGGGSTMLLSSELERVSNESIDTEGMEDWQIDNLQDWSSLATQGIEGIEQFNFHGTHRPEMMEFTAELLSLHEGRFFTDAEVTGGEHVAIVSQDFADTNNLTIGSTFALDNQVFDSMAASEEHGWFSWHTLLEDPEAFLMHSEEIVLTIVGTFNLEMELDFTGNNSWQAGDTFFDYSNRIYVPNQLISAIMADNFEIEREILDLDEDAESTPVPNAVYMLRDSRDLEAFHAAAANILPEFWQVVDMSNAFGTLASSMDSMLMIANIVMWVAIGATIVIITLLITLFLRDRRQEIGIYLALGEKRGKIISQILLEVLSVSIIALVISVFSGNMLSANISREMLQNDLLSQQAEAPWLMSQVDVPWELRAFAPAPMSIEEMVAAYDTSMEPTTILVFLGVGLGTVLVSTLVPIGYITSFDPKKIML